MTDRYTEFLTELADLMERHQVTISAREESSSWYTSAEGIEIDFDYIPSEDYDNRPFDNGDRTIVVGTGTCEINARDIRESIDD